MLVFYSFTYICTCNSVTYKLWNNLPIQAANCTSIILFENYVCFKYMHSECDCTEKVAGLIDVAYTSAQHSYGHSKHSLV